MTRRPRSILTRSTFGARDTISRAVCDRPISRKRSTLPACTGGPS
ncbi:hypothetical protein [Caudoviricetes sp.]|nr:hypothetical protein [Caudoviricetes sp.]